VNSKVSPKFSDQTWAGVNVALEMRRHLSKQIRSILKFVLGQNFSKK